MLLSIIMTPLIVFLVLGFFGRYLGRNRAIIAPDLRNALFSFVSFFHFGIILLFTWANRRFWVIYG
jgi:hypothetical protein